MRKPLQPICFRVLIILSPGPLDLAGAYRQCQFGLDRSLRYPLPYPVGVPLARSMDRFNRKGSIPALYDRNDTARLRERIHDRCYWSERYLLVRPFTVRFVPPIADLSVSLVKEI